MARRILVADDDSLFCKLLQYTLEQMELDWDVRTTATGREVLAAIGESQPDLLLLDLKMPDGDGFSVLEQRRAQGHTYPVVVVSHLPTEENETRCTELGARRFVPKMRMRMADIIDVIARELQPS